MLITGVLEGDPTDRGGLRLGDILTKVNGNRIKDVRQLLNQIAQITPGNSAAIEVLRRVKELEVKVQVRKNAQAKIQYFR
jgi:serine protease DegQ